MPAPARFNVLGVGVHALDLAQARESIVSAARGKAKGYVCCCDVNSISCARRDPSHRARLNHSFLTTPDGMPLVWLGRRAGHREIGRVYGPDLLNAVCAETAGTNLRHFFYGAGPGTAELLAEHLRRRFPGLQIAGTHTPPFRDLTDEEGRALKQTVAALQPDFFWVGLSTPKQERFMAEYLGRFDTTLMIGVGAAFDFFAGRVRQAPRWVQRGGLEWLWRIGREPRRLGGRYLRNVPLFIVRTAAQMTGLRQYPL
jgi:N-acetylglucosaminyldiphosphoundecaprenol N-acetyl-beta-D-mannosaminyltransferase